MWWVEVTQHQYFYHGVLAFGSFTLLVGAYLAWEKIQFIKDSAFSVGKVVGIREHQDIDSVSWFPNVLFTTSHGLKVECECLGSGPRKAYEVGETVNVIYDKENPVKASINTRWRLWVIEFSVLVVGVAFISAGISNL